MDGALWESPRRDNHLSPILDFYLWLGGLGQGAYFFWTSTS